MITPTKKLPRYLKFAQQMQARIDSGTLMPGDKLPAQRELATQFGTTLMTIRKGLNMLAESGVVRIEHGVGTFVNSPNLEDSDFQLLSFSHTLQERSLSNMVTQPLAAHRAVAHDDARRGLHLPDGAPMAMLERVRLLNGVPFAYQRSYMPADLYAVAEGYTAQSSLYGMLQAAAGRGVTSAKEVLVPVLLSAEKAKLLHAKTGDPAWLSIRISATADGTPIVYDEATLKQEQFVVTLEHFGQRTTCKLQMVDSQSPNMFDYLMDE